jgi:hypothetical protein
MKAMDRKKVHPWYKGQHEWEIIDNAEVSKPISYKDAEQGDVKYNPKIVWLQNSEHERVLWFAYWISTDKTGNKMKWGQGPPMLEEETLLELFKDGISKDLFSDEFLNQLYKELANK